MADATTQGRSPERDGSDLGDWLFGVPAARPSPEDATPPDGTGLPGAGCRPADAPEDHAGPVDARLLALDVEGLLGDHGDLGGDPAAGGVVDATFGDARLWARRGVPPRRGAGRRITTRGALALLGVTGLLVASPAAGYWLASTTTSGSVGASTLGAPASLSASATPTSLSVAVLAPNSGPTPTGYTVTLTGGTAQPCTMSQGKTSPAATCALSGLASGTSYTFAVRPTLGSWVGPSTSLTTSTAAAPAPAVPSLAASSDSGASSSDGVTNDATPTYSGAATSGLGGATITLYAGSTAVGSTTAAADGSWNVTPSSAVADGSYTVTAKASLNGGQAGSASAGTSLRIDTTNPAAPTASAVTCGAVNGTAAVLAGVFYCGSSTWSASTGVQWTFSANDPVPSGGLATYRYTSTSSSTSDPADPTAPTTTTGTPVSAGSPTSSGLMTGTRIYKVNVIAVDTAGNVSPSAVLKTVVDVNVPAAATVSWTTNGTSLCSNALSSQTTVYCKGSDPVVTPSATDSATTPVSGLDKIWFTTDGTTPVAGSSSGVASGSQLPSGTFSAEGSKTLKLLAADKAGNTSTTSTTVVTDRTAPTVSSVTLANGRTAGTVDQRDTITIAYSDNVSGLSPKTWCLDWTGTPFTGTGTLSVNNAGTSDTVTFAAASNTCTSAFAFGTVQLNADYVSSTTGYAMSFSWSGTSGSKTGTLTITLGSRSGGVSGLQSNVGSAAAGVTPSATATDLLGNAMTASAVTSAGASRF